MASSRNLARGGPAKNYFGIPRSLTLRLFDSNSSQSNPQPVKSDASYNATSDPRQRPAGRSNSSSQSVVPPDSSFFVHSDRQRLRNSVFDRPFKRKASGNSRGYGIYPSGSKNTFIYESSISSKSDIQSLSEHPKPDGDADSILSYGGDVSSIRARCSAETLHSIAPESVADSSPTDSPTHSPRRIVPVNLPALIEAQNSITAGIIALSLPQEDSDSDSTINGDSYGAPEPHNPDPRGYPTTPSVSRRPLPEPRPLPMVPYAPRPAANVPLPPPRRPEPPVLPQTQPRLRRDSVDRAASTQNQPMQIQMQGTAYPAHAVSTPGPARTPIDINSAHAFPPGLSSDPPISPVRETHAESRSATAYFDALSATRDPKEVVNWMTHELLGQLSARGQTFHANPVSVSQMGNLIDLVQSGTITRTSGRLLLRHMLDEPTTELPETLAQKLALTAMDGGHDALAELCQEAVIALPEDADAVRAGRVKALNKLVGRVMKSSRGRADAQAVRRKLHEILLPDTPPS
ncbi:hypothetical protein EWM64_g3504 [Hericium alpestre]|uniref:Asn/Gln amidotransferase domain-containing protein n=1 Tax=Hericium alpestre TaxID=135208 RepID=A0A4Z0A066_9AGAM|nr:hypothetical protein EWM64_g3504 [Hericium alpestre]